MPVCADASDTVPFVLDGDKSKDNPAKFKVRFLSDQETRKVRKKLDAAGAEKDEDKSIALVEEALLIGVAGVEDLNFRGQAVELEQLARDGFSSVLSSKELWELAYGQLSATALAEHDRFKSASAQGSEPAPSANPADLTPA